MVKEEYKKLRYIQRKLQGRFSETACPYDFEELRELSHEGWLRGYPSPAETLWELTSQAKSDMREFRRQETEDGSKLFHILISLLTLAVTVATLLLQWLR